jgi:ElaA protein
MITIKHYNDISKEEFHDIISLRIEVFVVEQDCPYQELDGLDKDAYHLILKEKDVIIGTMRLLKPGVVYDELAIGRVVSSPKHRGKGLGHKMMTFAMDYIRNELKLTEVRLSAQSHLTNYYEKYNFVKTGKEYLEDGIPHSEMLYNEAD